MGLLRLGLSIEVLREESLPNHSFILLLPNVRRDFTVDLPGCQGHRQSFRHVFLDGFWYG